MPFISNVPNKILGRYVGEAVQVGPSLKATTTRVSEYFGTSSVAEQKGSLAARTVVKLPNTHADLST